MSRKATQQPATNWRSRIIGEGDEAPDQLLANPANWRVHPKAQQDALAGVLDEVGWVQRVIVNQRTGHLVDGHLRVALALRQDAATVPVLYVDLDEAEEKLVLATIDPVAALAVPDAEKLRALLDDVQSGSAAVQQMLADLSEDAGVLADKAGLTDPDAVPDLRKTDIVRGDLFQLGQHRLLCGDSTKAEDVERVMGGERADLLFTDPPYAIFGSSTGVSGEIADDKMIRPFFRDILSLARNQTKPFAHLFICCDWRSWSAWWDVAKDCKISVKNCIVWDKSSPALGSMFRSQHEFMLFAVNSYVSTAHISGSRSGQRLIGNETNVWQVSRELSGEKEHNAQKPVALVSRALMASSDAGAVVIDPFSGSGTTIIACEQLNRRCFAIEIEPAYVQVAIDRWEAFTGQKAVKCG